jgi:hypothetical protein
MSYKLLLSLLFFPSLAYCQSSTSTNEAIVNAIYRIEGGDNAQYAYGIRSIPYKDKTEARRICYNTVRNNRKRYAKAVEKGYKGDYLSYLASRYCPTSGRLSRAELRLNGNWLRNLRKVLAQN